MAGVSQSLYERDGKWPRKLAFRLIQTGICFLAIGCAIYVLTEKSKFQSQSWRYDNVVRWYLPMAAVAIVFNLFFIIYILTTGQYFNLMYTSIIHFMLTFAFGITGCYITISVVAAVTQMSAGPYDLGETRLHNGTIVHKIFNGTSINGTLVQVNASNVAECPAFYSCSQQRAWMSVAHIRSIVALVGGGLVDVMFVLNAIQFFWCTKDSVFGTRPRSCGQPQTQDVEKATEQQPPILDPDTSSPSLASGSTVVSSPPSIVMSREDGFDSSLTLTSSDVFSNKPPFTHPSRPPQPHRSLPPPKRTPSEPPSMNFRPTSVPHLLTFDFEASSPNRSSVGLERLVNDTFAARSSLLSVPEPIYVRRGARSRPSISLPGSAPAPDEDYLPPPPVHQRTQSQPTPPLLSGTVFSAESSPTSFYSSSSGRSSPQDTASPLPDYRVPTPPLPPRRTAPQSRTTIGATYSSENRRSTVFSRRSLAAAAGAAAASEERPPVPRRSMPRSVHWSDGFVA